MSLPIIGVGMVAHAKSARSPHWSGAARGGTGSVPRAQYSWRFHTYRIEL